MFSKQDKSRDAFMLDGVLAGEGYDWWWHSFTGVNDETGEEKTFFVEFFAINPKYGKSVPVLGQAENNLLMGVKPSYLMVKAGWWGEKPTQIHRFFGWNEVLLHKRAPFIVEAGDCLAGEYELRGNVSVSSKERDSHPEWMCDAGSMQWDLRLNKMIPFHAGYGAGRLARKLNAFEMYWHAEGMKTLYSGEIVANGVHYTVYPGRSYGYADKNWGRNFTSPWLWLASNDITSVSGGRRLLNSAFDIGGGCPKVFGIPLKRKLLGGFYYEGEDFEFNFSKFRSGTRTRFCVKETKDALIWHVRMENRKALLDVKVKCFKKEMLFVNYEAPDGTKRHNRLYNGGTGRGVAILYEKHPSGLYLVDEMKLNHVGCEYGEYDS